MYYRSIQTLVIILCFMGMVTLQAQTASRTQRLNNFVTEILKVQLGRTAQREFLFTNPRDGWVFLSISPGTASSANIQISIDGLPLDKALILNQKSKSMEAMRRLSAGSHKLKILSKEKTSRTIIIRTMPEIMFIRYTGDIQSPDGAAYRPSSREAHGADRLHLYYWDFLSTSIFKDVNVLLGTPAEKQAAEWTAQGKEIINGSWFFTNDPEELYKEWSKSFKPPAAGMIADEFVPPSLGFDDYIIDTIRRIHETPELKGNFYAYIGFPSGSKAEDFRKLMEPLMKYGYRWVPEFYLFEQPSELHARDNLDKLLRQRMLDFRKTYPGSEKSCVACPSILEAWDNIPNVDFKVWLDMQFNMMANDSAFKDLYGICAYQSTYADTEIILWLSELYRHYCIEGRKGMLSSRFGYKYMLDHIVNVTENGKGWILDPAEKGSIEIRNVGDIPIRQGYLPKGKHVFWTKRNEKRANNIIQDIKNLKPGKLYSLKMYVCEPTDSGAPQKYALSVNISGAQVLNDRSQQDIQRGDGSGTNKACWNYIYRVFRATSARARLEISDWPGNAAPVGPVGQELIYDFIQIQPLFESK